MADQYTYEAAPTVSGVSPAGGPLAGGATVVVTGANFTGATAVMFGIHRCYELRRQLSNPDHRSQPRPSPPGRWMHGHNAGGHVQHFDRRPVHL